MESTRNVKEKQKYQVASYFYDEDTEWGWKYGFSLNRSISVEQLRELINIIENHLNKYKNEIQPKQ